MDKNKIINIINKVVDKKLEYALEKSNAHMRDKIKKEVLERVGSFIEKLNSHQDQLESRINKLEQRLDTMENEVKRLQKGEKIAPKEGEGKEADDDQEFRSPVDRDRGKSGSSRTPRPALEFLKNAPEEDPNHRTEPNQTSRSQETGDPSFDQTTTESSATAPNSDQQIVDDFNRFLHGDLSKDDFEEQYNPIQLGIENEEERLDEAQAPLLLQKDVHGQYIAVERDNYYLVLPNYNLVLQESTRRQAGFDEVFQCGDAPHQHPYQVKRVDRGARFTAERQGRFELDVPGSIALERYG